MAASASYWPHRPGWHLKHSQFICMLVGMSRPMREPTFWILTALVEQPRHGYDVMRHVGALSGGEVRLLAATLYAALDRLAAEGLVEVDREETVDGRPRRYYRLTNEGGAALTAETHRLSRNVKAATRLLGARGAGAGPATVTFGRAGVAFA
jgi:PadR family transcriptional regulator PadR